MYTVTVVFHVLACLALILIVLLQTGKGAEMGAAFGGASQTLFGGSGGTTFLSKLTTGAAVVFMITCLGLTYLSTGPSTKSVMEDVPVEKSEAPLLPDAKPIQPGAQPAAVKETVPKPEAAAAQVTPEKSAAQAQEATKAQQQAPAKEETKATSAKPQEKRQEKPPAAAKKQ
jgi:preprotein translocase subunit SecG